ncbi:MAG: tRNA pseudouridine(55) synthase TruB [Defluviitaleaceae bacterium]|nr:tRNA pseudouridine(55) synthase TruB [Defluviitaleaceae bacterium]
MLSGIINIHKEKDYTSHDVVAIVRRLLGRVKTGHTGTLDPQAEGVLPICIGRATKLASYLTASDKSYRAQLILGMTTDTYDHTGEILTTTSADTIPTDFNTIQEAVDFFVGGYMQLPPMYSALKIDGKKLYELARTGKTVERKPRPITISNITIIEKDLTNNRLWMDVDCSKGTYIRSLCVDIGEKLGCGGCMGNLIRTKSGAFTLDNAIRLSELEQMIQSGDQSFLIPADQALPAPKGILKDFFTKAINGHPVPLAQVIFKNENKPADGQHCWIYDKSNNLEDDTLIGLYAFNAKAQVFKPEVMMYANHT